MIKVYNGYAGIGGNRKLWSYPGVEITAVEKNEEIAEIYRESFPSDKLIVGDAHKYLLEHYHEFDFIWLSPPCPTHSKSRFWNSKGGGCVVKYPDMKLWQEIIFLQHHAKTNQKFLVENVEPYYAPLIAPTQKIGRHLFWANFIIPKINYTTTNVRLVSQKNYGFDLTGKKLKHRKDQILRNIVNPDLGLHIFNQVVGVITQQNTNQTSMELE